MRRRTLLVVALSGLTLLATGIVYKRGPGGGSCFASIGCLITDGVSLCLDDDLDGVACETSEPNLTLNAPTSAAGDETVQGNLTVVGDLSVTGSIAQSGSVFQSPATGSRALIALGTAPFTTTSCPSGQAQAASNTFTCASAQAIVESIPFDTQILVKQFTCGWNFAALDASDSVTFCVKEANATSASCVGSVTIQFTNADAAGAVKTVAVNALTTKTADYILTAAVSAFDDSTAGAETVGFSCHFTYEYP